MSDKDKELTGVMFFNDRKTKHNSPEFRGSFLADGQKFSISCWYSSNHSGTDAGKGLLFPNPKKGAETHPDFVGWIITPSKVRYSVSAWKRSSEASIEYLKLSLKEWSDSGIIAPVNSWGLACQDWKL